MDRFQKMKKVKDEVVGCTKCSLHKKRNLPVVGEGSHEADIVFVGEAPGANEDRTGRPFCGRAGSVLNQLLSSIQISRQAVYICNILKCRPPNNRDPRKEEVEACTPYLESQLEIIKPKVVSPLGRHAAGFIMEKYGLGDKMQGISRIHGQTFEVSSPFGKVTIIPLYHPAVATYRASMKETLKEDFKVLEKYKK